MVIPKRQPRETGRDYALRTLKQSIISLDLAPGSMVSESDLAARMGLSRTPVREALLELAKVQIVEIYPQRGSVVALIDYGMVEEARFIRSVLECAVVELVCQTISPEELEALSANVDMQEYVLGSRMPEQLWDLDNAFHRMLFRIARKEQAQVMIEWVSIHFDRVRNLSLKAVKDLKIVADHRALAEAFARRDVQEARQIMDRHLNRYKIDEQALRASHPDYFVPARGASPQEQRQE